MDMVKNKWPNDYPDHIKVPSEEAVELDESLYRLVSNSIPDATDFLASYKDPAQKGLIRHSRFKNNPEFYGTSFYSKEEDIQSLVDGNPERFAKNKIAKGFVKPMHGKGLCSNRTSHVSVWFYDGVYPEEFVLI